MIAITLDEAVIFFVGVIFGFLLIIDCFTFIKIGKKACLKWWRWNCKRFLKCQHNLLSNILEHCFVLYLHNYNCI